MTRNTVSAVFDDRTEAQQAIAELRRAGVDDDAISIVGRPDDDDDRLGDSDREGHSIGNVASGVAAGGVAGALLGVAALASPGVGPLAAAGAIAASAVPTAAAVGGAAGATAGALAKMLTDNDVGREDAEYYEERINSGGIFVSVDTRRSNVDPELASDILYRSGGHSASRPKTVTTA